MIKVMAVRSLASAPSTELVNDLHLTMHGSYRDLQHELCQRWPGLIHTGLGAVVLDDSVLKRATFQFGRLPKAEVLTVSPSLQQALELLQQSYKQQEEMCELIGSLASEAAPIAAGTVDNQG